MLENTNRSSGDGIKNTRALWLTVLMTIAIQADGIVQAADPSTAQQTAQTAQQNWNSLSKAEQTQKKAEAINQAADKKAAWQALSPEEKQAKRNAFRAQMKEKFGGRFHGQQ